MGLHPERPAQEWKDGTKEVFACSQAVLYSVSDMHALSNATGHQQASIPLYLLLPFVIALKIKCNRLVLHTLLQEGAEMQKEPSCSTSSSALQ